MISSFLSSRSVFAGALAMAAGFTALGPFPAFRRLTNDRTEATLGVALSFPTSEGLELRDDARGSAAVFGGGLISRSRLAKSTKAMVLLSTRAMMRSV